MVALKCLLWGALHNRHTFATELLSKDTRLDVIQRVMGHADISTTGKYAETLNRDILDIVEPIRIVANVNARTRQ